DAGVRGEAARGRGECKEAESRQQETPSPELVTEAAGRDEEDREGEAVAGDHPFDRAAADPELKLDRGHGNVDDEEVEDDHEGASHQHWQREPTPGLGLLGPDRSDGNVDRCGCSVSHGHWYRPSRYGRVKSGRSCGCLAG